MKEFIKKHLTGIHRFEIISSIVLFVALVSGGSFYYLINNIKALRGEMASTTQILSERVSALEAGLATSTLTSQQLAQKLLEEQQKSSEFEESISDISGTVNTLEKLSKTDKELLQKYSKVYFLSDNYVPMRLETIDTKYLRDENKEMEFHASALPYLQKMLNRAEDDGVTLKIVSAYRSFGTQSTLKNGYTMIYGSGANQFSADQGYSEHQLGTTVDLASTEVDAVLTTKFETTPAFAWLNKNAYKYGFVLSYPKGNSYYQYEPWHWRFVGVRLATRLHNDEINFSDMEQRQIDTYLVKIFD